MFDMIDISPRQDGDRLVVELDPNEPVGLEDLSSSFAALSRMYDRLYSDGSGATRLYLTKISSGSVIAEVAPFAVIMGGIAIMDASLVVADFSRRLGDGLRAFAGTLPPDTQAVKRPVLLPQDAADLRDFVRPLVGKNGATLGIKRATLISETAERKLTVDYRFEEADLNRAALNMERYIDVTPTPPTSGVDEYFPFSDKLLLVGQASRQPGRQSGRTGDRGMIPDFSEDQVPLHFARSINDIKSQIMRTSINPLSDFAFIVSGYRVVRGGALRSYLITELHDVVERPPDDE